MPIQSALERLYERRWWISVPLITVSVIAGSELRDGRWSTASRADGQRLTAA